MSRFSIPPRSLPLREMHRQEQNLARSARSQAIAVTLTPSQVSANSVSEQAFTVTGVPSNSQVVVDGPSQTAGIMMGQARVSGQNQLTIPFANVTGGGVTPASGTYTVRVIR